MTCIVVSISYRWRVYLRDIAAFPPVVAPSEGSLVHHMSAEDKKALQAEVVAVKQRYSQTLASAHCLLVGAHLQR